MKPARPAPGPDAARAFRLGTVAAVLVGLTVAGVLYWLSTVPLFLFSYVLLLLFPVYLLVVAVVLSVWLGYDKDATALRPVSRTER